MSLALASPAFGPSSRRQLLAVTLLVVLLHALLLFGLPRLGRIVSAGQNTPAFETRLIAPPAPTPADTPRAPEAPPAPAPPPAPAAKRAPVDRTPARPRPSSKPRPAPAGTDTATPAEPSLFTVKSPVGFGGGSLAVAITPPLSDTQADVVLAFEQAQDGAPPVRIPRASWLSYQTTGVIGGQPLDTTTTLNWRQDGRWYDAEWRLFTNLTGDRTRITTGLLTPQGLAPVSARLGYESVPSRFDYDARRVHFGASDTSARLKPGMQDRVGALLQLGSLLAGDPARYPQGSVIEMPAAHERGPGQWRFAVLADEDVSVLGGKSVPTVRLLHTPDDAQDARIEVWLGRSLDYLPARLMITEPNGDRVDSTLSTAIAQPTPTPSAATAVPVTPPR